MNNLERSCPECKHPIVYTSIQSYKRAIKKGSFCPSCSIKGARNGFFGRRHLKKTKDKISKIKTGIKQTGDILKTSQRTIKLAKETQLGKSVYRMWLEKYGKDIADAKDVKYRLKQSKLNSGKNNNMYGKPSPQGSGNGWAGWYKEFHFRSLRELSYIVFVLEAGGHDFISAQTKDLRIKYKDWMGRERTYTADFLVDEKYLIEIKPQKLWDCKEVQFKKNAAEEFCKKRGLIYQLIDPEIRSSELKEKYDNGEIVFLNKYKIKFEEFLKNTYK